MPYNGAFTAADLEPLLRGLIHSWRNREDHPVLDYQVQRLSEALASELLQRYAFPRLDRLSPRPRHRASRHPVGPA